MEDFVSRLLAPLRGISLTSKAADLFRSSCSIFLAALATSSSASFCSTVYKCWFLRKIYEEIAVVQIMSNPFDPFVCKNLELFEESISRLSRSTNLSSVGTRVFLSTYVCAVTYTCVRLLPAVAVSARVTSSFCI